MRTARFPRPARCLSTVGFVCFLIGAPDTLRGQDTSLVTLVTTIGVDTLAVEQYVRVADRISGTLLRRSPSTELGEYTVRFSAAGQPMTLEYKPVASAHLGSPGSLRSLRIEFGADSLTMELMRDSLTTRRLPFAAAFPLLTDTYGLYELPVEHLRAVGRDSSIVTLFSPLGGASGSLRISRFGSDSARVWILGAPMRVSLRDGRVIAVDGTATVAKHVVTRASRNVDMAALTAAFLARDSAAGPLGRWISPRDTVTATIGSASLWIDYGRPSRRGRTLYVNGVLGDTLWRAGANAATQFRSSEDLQFGNARLPAGTYSIFMQVAPDGSATLIFNSQIGQWGTIYDRNRDVLRVPVNVQATRQPVEMFTIFVERTGASSGWLMLSWGERSFVAPFDVFRR